MRRRAALVVVAARAAHARNAPAAGRPGGHSSLRSSDSSLTAFLFSGRGRRHGTVEASIDAFSTVEAGSVSYRNDANNGRVVVR